MNLIVYDCNNYPSWWLGLRKFPDCSGTHISICVRLSKLFYEYKSTIIDSLVQSIIKEISSSKVIKSHPSLIYSFRPWIIQPTVSFSLILAITNDVRKKSNRVADTGIKFWRFKSCNINWFEWNLDQIRVISINLGWW